MLFAIHGGNQTHCDKVRLATHSLSPDREGRCFSQGQRHTGRVRGLGGPCTRIS